MKKVLLILSCLLSFALRGQVVFKSIVPQQPIVVGESFRVQYVAEGAENFDHFIAPSFSGFSVLPGPEVYNSNSLTNKDRKFRNTIYTLKAIKVGRHRIAGAVAGIDGRNYRSDDVWIEVITIEEAEQQRRENGAVNDNSPYFLKPGEDPYDKIRQNLFVKVLVDKKTCYIGEAVVATFKLYSRLESKSEIIKNPGLYGFTVHDMVGLSDKVVTTETVNGRPFDVHTIRQVQLYPLQVGSFTIDPMEINNKVEFSRSYVIKKTEQEISEGGSLKEDEMPAPGTVMFESNTRTEPVNITVRPTPSKNRPSDYNGATGRFNIKASFEKNELAKNEEGYLVLTISGKGNFSQISAPVIQWPKGVEGFDPSLKESIEQSVAPLRGNKSFRYPFVTDSSGTYKFPLISFSFFDPDTNTYRTVYSSVGEVVVTNKEKTNSPIVPATRKKSIMEVNRKASRMAVVIVGALVILILLYWSTRKKEPIKVVTINAEAPSRPTTEEILYPVLQLLDGSDREFYSSLYHTIWSQLGAQFHLSGTEMNKQVLGLKLMQIEFSGREELLSIIQTCEAGMFTSAQMEGNRMELLERVRQLLNELQS